MDWTLSQARTAALIERLGSKVTLIKADDSTATAYAVWDSNSKLDLAQGGSKITGNAKQLYIAGNIKKAPVPGDYIKQGNDQWHINEVEQYRPTTVVLAYRIVVE